MVIKSHLSFHILDNHKLQVTGFGFCLQHVSMYFRKHYKKYTFLRSFFPKVLNNAFSVFWLFDTIFRNIVLNRESNKPALAKCLNNMTYELNCISHLIITYMHVTGMIDQSRQYWKYRMYIRVYLCLYLAAQQTDGTQRSSLTAQSGCIKQEEKRRKNWEEVAVLQIEAKRIHAMNRKHRKFVSITYTKALFLLLFTVTFLDFIQNALLIIL